MRWLLLAAACLAGCSASSRVREERLSPVFTQRLSKHTVIGIRPPVGPDGAPIPFAAGIHEALLEALEGPSHLPNWQYGQPLTMPRTPFGRAVSLQPGEPTPGDVAVVVAPVLNSELEVWPGGGRLQLEGRIEIRTPRGRKLHAEPWRIDVAAGPARVKPSPFLERLVRRYDTIGVRPARDPDGRPTAGSVRAREVLVDALRNLTHFTFARWREPEGLARDQIAPSSCGSM